MPDQAAAPSAGPGGRRAVVAFDALGAEGGAEVVVPGVRKAAAEKIPVRVFGRRAELGDLSALDGVEVVEATEVVSNEEEPVAAVRSRPEASIVMAAADVADGRSAALASPGSTGATMTAALFALKRLRGVQRPALAVQLPAPGLERPVLMLDVGANADNRASHLVQFASLGAAFSSSVLGTDRPRVGLLSVGAEAKKGSMLVVEAHEALAASEPSGFEFVGNVEGGDLLTGAADVIVTDGFTGNVTLKTIEGTARAVGGAVRSAARSGPRAAAGGVLMKSALGDLRGRLDPDRTGGAILLGLRGVAVVGHGSAGPEGIANQIRLAAHAAEVDAPARTGELLAESGAGRAAMRERDAGGEEVAEPGES
jgi:glycerol-3-phosphate acyltransferase PlsX